MKIWTWQLVLLTSIFIVSIMAAGCSVQSSTTHEITPTATPLYKTYNGTISKYMPAISAMDGFSIAEKDALSWKNDAISGSIIGGVTDLNESIPINGKTTKWTYFFTSPSSNTTPDTRIIIVYGDGTIFNSQIGINTELNPAGLGDYSEVYRKANWKVDSTQAVQIALPLFKTKYNMDAVGAFYQLIDNRANSTDKADFYWEIVLLGPSKDNSTPILFSNNKLYIYIDAATGANITDPHLTAT